MKGFHTETDYLLRSPTNAKRLQRSIADAQHGKTVPHLIPSKALQKQIKIAKAEFKEGINITHTSNRSAALEHLDTIMGSSAE